VRPVPAVKTRGGGGGGGGVAVCLTSALERGGWSTPHHGRFNPGRKTLYPLVIDGNIILKWILNKVGERVVD